VIGGGTAADVVFQPQTFPNENRPNNLVAPLWNDLNPPAGGAIRIGVLTDGVNSWIVVYWGMQAGSGGRLSVARLPALPTATTRRPEQCPAPNEKAAAKVPRRDARTRFVTETWAAEATTRTRSRAAKPEPPTW
jgi:hypothetical protein